MVLNDSAYEALHGIVVQQEPAGSILPYQLLLLSTCLNSKSFKFCLNSSPHYHVCTLIFQLTMLETPPLRGINYEYKDNEIWAKLEAFAGFRAHGYPDRELTCAPRHQPKPSIGFFLKQFSTHHRAICISALVKTNVQSEPISDSEPCSHLTVHVVIFHMDTCPGKRIGSKYKFRHYIHYKYNTSTSPK